MKKIISIALSLSLLLCTATPVFASSTELQPAAVSAVQPRASLVFAGVDSSISASTYKCSFVLNGIGSADVTITLEKKSGSSWDYVDSESWSSSSVKSKTVAKTYFLTEPGTYRCSYSISATVGSNSDYRSGSTSGYVKS